jgi:hypothetical protein
LSGGELASWYSLLDVGRQHLGKRGGVFAARCKEGRKDYDASRYLATRSIHRTRRRSVHGPGRRNVYRSRWRHIYRPWRWSLHWSRRRLVYRAWRRSLYWAGGWSLYWTRGWVIHRAGRGPLHGSGRRAMHWPRRWLLYGPLRRAVSQQFASARGTAKVPNAEQDEGSA